MLKERAVIRSVKYKEGKVKRDFEQVCHLRKIHKFWYLKNKGVISSVSG